MKRQVPRPEEDYFVHETAVVDQGAQIGAQSRIWHFCHIMSGAIIGARCTLGQNVYVGGRVVLGDGVKVQNNVSLYDGVVLEDDVFCGPSVVFTNVRTPRSFVSRKAEYRPTRVCRGATLGANATILCGLTIGAYAMIGAGSVLTGEVAPFALLAGVPARQIGWVCRCGERLSPPPTSANQNHCANILLSPPRVFSCLACGDRYLLTGDQLLPTNLDQY